MCLCYLELFLFCSLFLISLACGQCLFAAVAICSGSVCVCFNLEFNDSDSDDYPSHCPLSLLFSPSRPSLSGSLLYLSNSSKHAAPGVGNCLLCWWFAGGVVSL